MSLSLKRVLREALDDPNPNMECQRSAPREEDPIRNERAEVDFDSYGPEKEELNLADYLGGAAFDFPPPLRPLSARREDGGISRRRQQPTQSSGRQHASGQGPAIPKDSFFANSETAHGKLCRSLELRLKRSKAISACWQAGDLPAVASVLEASWDPPTVAHVLRLLSGPPAMKLSPAALSRLLPLAQRLAQVDCEEQAVLAMTFVLNALEVSWPPIVQALHAVSTPQATCQACEEAVRQMTALSSCIRTMSRSVRLSRNSNGPLVPTCRKLKLNLEKALSELGGSSRAS
mmetsp:Transcript_23706/g.50639  ORF Transcript_23706/g.50639 Transcript_23706/m.50639 type:complete len:290 (+) Transcript_23706:181-1050(+)